MAKNTSRPPLARMLRIHERLQRATPADAALVNCTALSAELEVSYKTVQRDIDFMRDRLGLPILYDRRLAAFRYTQPVHHFPTVQISEGELVALAVARQAFGQYRGTPFERPLRAAFEKLTASLSDQIQFSWQDDPAISFRSAAGSANVGDLATFEAVSQAVLRCEEIEFDYQKLGADRPEPRRARPRHLACVDNAWYLFAHDLERDGEPIRTFALSRVTRLRGTGRLLERSTARFSLEEHLAGSFGLFAPASPPVEICLRFDCFAGRLIRERVWHASQRIESREDGTLDLHLSVSMSPELESWVLGWGERVEVIAPAIFRERVANVASQVAERHRRP